MMPFDQGTLEDALIPAVNGSAISLQRGVVTSPGKVLCPGDQEGNAVDGPVGAVGQLGYVLSVNGHRMWLPFDATVPWTIPGRHITIGPDGDGQPTLEMIRERPGYTARAVTYLAASGATTEFAVALVDNGVTQATLRVTKAGLLLQDNVGSLGSRYFAYQNDLAAAVNRVAALETAQAAEPASAAGVAGPITLSGTTATYTVSLPAGRFTAAPIIPTPSVYTGTQRCRADNITATSFRLVIWAESGATLSGTAYVYWHATAAH